MSEAAEQALLTRCRTGCSSAASWRPAAPGDTLDVQDPATGEVLKTIADAGVEDGAAALDAAVGAGPAVGLPPRRGSARRSCAARSS